MIAVSCQPSTDSRDERTERTVRRIIMCMQNYEILSGNKLVAVWKDKRLTVIDRALLPQYLKKSANADLWLSTRAIDAHRAHSRILKKALRMKERDDVATVLRANGVTITDNYWVRSIGSDLTYEQVRFDADYFKKKSSKSIATLSLSGSSRSFNVVAENSSAPAAELTNVGSFEKCWKNIDGKWWLFKAANHNEAFSEVFISKLCGVLGISCAVYESAGTGIVRTLDFTEGKTNFEPALTFMGEDEDYENVITALKELCPSAVPDYIRLIFLDALVFNPDRHTANFGLLRDKKTGEFLSLAPCFDHNMALISNGYPEGKTKKDLLITLFLDVMNAHPEYKAFLPGVSEEKIEEALCMTGMKVRNNLIIRYLMDRYEMIVRK